MKLHWKIIIGMALGVVFGLIMSQTSFGSDLIKDWVKPFGTIFINLLKLIAMPLILASLVKGISDLKDISKLSTIGTRTLGIYICTTVTAVIIGLILVNIVEPGSTITEETRIDLVQEYEQGVIEKQQQAQRIGHKARRQQKNSGHENKDAMHNLAHGWLAGRHLCLRARQRVNPLTTYCACAEHRRR